MLAGRVLRGFCWLDTEDCCCWWGRGLSSGTWFLGGKISFDGRFQASATKKMRTALFCVITQWLVVISYRRFETLVPSLGFKKTLPRLSQNVGKKLSLLTVSKPRRLQFSVWFDDCLRIDPGGLWMYWLVAVVRCVDTSWRSWWLEKWTISCNWGKSWQTSVRLVGNID
jgi:hypothetical protein